MIRAFIVAVENQINRFTKLLKGKNGKTLVEIMAEAQSSEDTLTIFYENFMLKHEETLANLIEEGKEKGEFRKNLYTPLAVDMIYGSIVYHLMSGAENLDNEFINNLPKEALIILKA
jgi:allophanate hydrolase subunit 1